MPHAVPKDRSFGASIPGKPQDFVTVDRDAPPVLAEFFARQNNACIEAFLSKGSDAAEPPLSREDGREDSSSGGFGGRGGDRDGGGGGGASTRVISFSHFVPRQELCPEKRLLWEPQLTKVICDWSRGRVWLASRCLCSRSGFVVAGGY